MDRTPTLIELRSLAHGGWAVGHPVLGASAGVPATWFVSGALPGERVEALPIRTRGGVAFGRTTRVVQASPDRRAPPCPLAGRCGGCDLQHAVPQAQGRLRRRIVEDALRTIGGVHGVEVGALPVPDAPEVGYRRRVKMHYRRRGDAFALGFRRAGAHELVDVASCPVLTPALDRAVQRVRALAEHLPQQGNVLGLDVGGGVVLGLPGVRPTEALLAKIRAALDEVLVGVELRGGRRRASVGTVRFIVDRNERGVGVRAGPFSFLQANAAVNAAMLNRVRELVGAAGPVLELYAGAGNWTRAWGRRDRPGVAVEADREAASNLGAMVRGQRWRVRVRRGRADRVAAALAAEGARFEVGLVDPPRAGLGPAVTDRLAELVTDRIVYVACDPATFARDVARLSRSGFALTSVAVADMMPNTSHAEIVARLVRRETAQ